MARRASGYRDHLRGKGTLKNEEDIEAAGKIWDILNPQFGGAKCCIARNDEKTFSVIWEDLARFDLGVIQKLRNAVEGCLYDLRIIGAGYAPAAPGASDNWTPLCLEVVMSKHGASGDCAASHSSGASQRSEDAIGTFDLSVVKDKNVRRIMGQFINCMQCGDRPDLYRHSITDAQYLHSEESGSHFLMLESMPTLNLSFIKKITYLFSGSLQNVVFERRVSREKGKWCDTDSATTMIVEIAGEPSYVVSRTGRIGRKRERSGFEPYSR